MSSTLSKLQQVVSNEAPQGNTAPAPAGDADDLVASLEEQLNDFYSDQAFAAEHFPNQSMRSVLEWAVSAKEKLAQAKASGTVEDFSFVPGNVMSSLPQMDQATADGLDFGLVEVDDQGVIKIYNQYECQLAGIQPGTTIGKNFFTDVAPCTNNKLFLGRFKNGVQANSLEVAFNYTFTYKMRPTAVAIAMYREPASNRNFVFVKKR
ncbi:PAS domain-containing protein [Pseudobacteriovorax antillogorgiicola]|uniref:Photoactive yellow protein n=1 Tax=Pseudobacteriovorax antillogorgiicola TaxID=1513793 RepID=A0A1Y6BAP7_9BACT|nr:PAS domain-containing protein [Pseudobacteriovorax antillogorgiicola]TCS57494.1 photoactive yellow protein [Pseudobacteriovorax antillogorgiicola]SMF00422.1 photoactive yellow protein [Pseudobacteriovorax antillogorgiicola]